MPFSAHVHCTLVPRALEPFLCFRTACVQAEAMRMNTVQFTTTLSSRSLVLLSRL